MSADLFTDGDCYLNWLIDVPMLLIQILFVAEIVGSERVKYITRFSLLSERQGFALA